MSRKSPGPQRAFVLAFVVLTSLVWCPWAYGTATGRVLSIPTWAVVAYAVAAALFALEWVFLFASGLAVNDKDRHRGNFTVREWETGGIRPLRRYVEHLADIRRIQKYIVDRAVEQGVPVVDNASLDENLSEVLGTMLQRVEEYGERAAG